jgi:hypothetical protein
LSPKQRQALRKLGGRRKNFLQRFIVLLDEFFFDLDQISAGHVGDGFRLQRGKTRAEAFLHKQKELDHIKEECRRLDIPSWIIHFEAP